MTALNRNPQNTNLLQPTKFLLTFSRLPDVQYFCQQINLPGVNMGQAMMNTPLIDIPIASNKLTYNMLNINFTVNENMSNWVQLYDWFRVFGSPKSMADRKTQLELQGGKLYSDATLTVLSALNNPIVSVNFFNAFPISLNDIQFDTTLSADTIVTGGASFMYSHYEIVPA